MYFFKIIASLKFEFILILPFKKSTSNKKEAKTQYTFNKF